VATRGTHILVARLSQLNGTTVFLTVLVATLAGLLLPTPYGPVLLLLLAGGLLVVLSVTWAGGTPQTRAARLIILVLLVVAAVARLV
jgi:hypothetical protein